MNVHPDLLKILGKIPRVPLGVYPTPLEHLPRLSQELNRSVYIKRDDLIGPALGGNKTRKLEFLLAEAQRLGHTKVATFGGLQSNHARLTAAAANRLGMQTHLFYFERQPTRLRGKLALNKLLGASMHYIPFAGPGRNQRIEVTSRLVHILAFSLIGRHYFIPVGGHTCLGCLGYVQAAIELDEQARQSGIPDATVWMAAGSGGTLAGMMAGLALWNSCLKPIGVDVGKLWKAFPASIARLANEICNLLGSSARFSHSRVPLIENLYVGPAYGSPSADGLQALTRLARTEGILLDPVYTAKAFAGMLDQIGAGSLEPGAPVIFLHTGGVPALFAFDEQQLLLT